MTQVRGNENRLELVALAATYLLALVVLLLDVFVWMPN